MAALGTGDTGSQACGDHPLAPDTPPGAKGILPERTSRKGGASTAGKENHRGYGRCAGTLGLRRHGSTREAFLRKAAEGPSTHRPATRHELGRADYTSGGCPRDRQVCFAKTWARMPAGVSKKRCLRGNRHLWPGLLTGRLARRDLPAMNLQQLRGLDVDA